MAGELIDVARVEIVPDFTRFEAETDSGVNDAMKLAGLAVDRAIADMEAQFTALGADIATAFDEIASAAVSSMSEIAADSQLSSDDIALRFDEMAAKVDLAFEEMAASADHSMDAMAAKGAETSATLGKTFGVLKTVGLGAGLALTGGLVAITGMGLKSAANLEQVKIAFQALTGSVAKGNAQFKQLQQFAAATPFEFNDLTTATEKFDAFSGSIGMSQDQLVPFLTTIGNLVAETGGGAQALNSISLALGQTAGQGKLTLGNLEQINNAIPGFNAVAAIAAQRGETQAQTLKEISSGAIDAKTGIGQLLAGMQQFPGAAGAMQKQSETLLGVFSTFKDTVSQALSGAFAPVIPAIKDSLGQITPIIGQAIGVLAPALGGVVANLLPLLGKLVAGIAPILQPLLDALGPALKTVGDALAPLSDSLSLVATALAPILPLAAELIVALARGLAPIISSLAPLIDGLLNGLGAAIGPLLPVVVKLGQVLGDALTPIFTVLGDVLQALGPVLGQLISAIATALAPLLEALAPVVVQLLDALQPLFPALLSLLPPIVDIVAALTPLITILAQLLVVAVDVLAPVIKLAAILIDLLASKAVAPLLELIAQSLALILSPLNKLIGPMNAFGKWLNGVKWDEVGKSILHGLGAGLTAVGHFFTDVWHAVSGFFTSLPGRISAFFSALPGLFLAGVTAAFHAFFVGLGFGIGLILKELMALPGQVMTILSDMWNGAVALFTKVIPHLIEWVAKLEREVLRWLGSLGPAALRIIADLSNSAVAHFSAGIDRVVAFVSKLPGRVLKFVTELPTLIGKAVADAGTWLYDAGKNLLKGLMNGIKSMVGDAINVVTGAMKDVVKGAESALGIHSPSKVFAEIGRQTVAGYTLGVDMHAEDASMSVSHMLNQGPSQAQGKSSGSGGGAALFGPGSIVVQFSGSTPTAQEAQAVGQAVGQGIADALARRDARNAVRTA